MRVSPTKSVEGSCADVALAAADHESGAFCERDRRGGHRWALVGETHGLSSARGAGLIKRTPTIASSMR